MREPSQRKDTLGSDPVAAVIKKAVRIVVLAYASLLVMFFIFQSRLLYHPSRTIISTPADEGLPYEDIYFKGHGDLMLHGWYVPAGEGATVLFHHGNSGNVSRRVDIIKIFNRLGLNVFIFDYGGYGKSPGAATEHGTYMDSRAAWKWLTGEKGVSPEKVIIYGRSLGSAIASRLATEVTAAALVLDSAFTSIEDIAAEKFPFIPARLLCRFGYDNLESLENITVPVLIVHSTADELIPVEHGKRLFNAAKGPKELLLISGSHDSGFLESGEAFEGPFKGFVDEYVR